MALLLVVYAFHFPPFLCCILFFYLSDTISFLLVSFHLLALSLSLFLSPLSISFPLGCSCVFSGFLSLIFYIYLYSISALSCHFPRFL
ncbi:hypothetical protein EV702DRAFT_313903 [Suillus placidus]|uniref:Uncharacterized protein n=1 Tax=Suillus placidus TaxID=48579 RepID=A0A9P6ZU31_9AGAM|nr:hypothetical protein EV702DRAFT_313903 [Suillus placidus]